VLPDVLPAAPSDAGGLRRKPLVQAMKLLKKDEQQLKRARTELKQARKDLKKAIVTVKKEKKAELQQQEQEEDQSVQEQGPPKRRKMSSHSGRVVSRYSRIDVSHNYEAPPTEHPLEEGEAARNPFAPR
jgi:hypothetical protein